MPLTKIESAMTKNVLRTDITNQLLDADIALRNIGFHNNVPIGTIMLWYTDTAPAGWILCNGQTESIAVYPDLFAKLGTDYGGNGTTTFGIPDMSGDSPVSLSNSGGTYMIRGSNAAK